MNSNPRQQNITLTSYLCLSLLLIAYVVWRSIAVSFTHDESLSYTIITGNDAQMYTANNHWLNTILMFLSSRVFGYSEWALRLPNVIAFAVYLFFIFRIFQHFCGNIYALIIAAPLLLLNPFMIDFFGMARGYGLGMCFFTVSLYYFLACFQKEQSAKNGFWLIFSSVCCVYSNYAFLTAILAVHGAALFYFFSVHRKKMVQLAVLYVAEILLLIPAVLNVLYLSEKNELYAGGDRHVFHDTLKSVISFSFSTGEDVYNLTLIACILLALCGIIGLFFYRNRSLNFVKVIILFLLLIPTVLHFAIGMKYPKDRAALYWMIVAGLFVMLAIDAILRSTRFRKLGWIPVVPMIAAAVLQLANFIPNANVSHTIIWKYDSDVKNAIKLIERQTDAKQCSLGVNWLLEPAVNYYRETKHIHWFAAVPKETEITANHDFFLVFKDNLPALQDSVSVVKYDPVSEIYILKRKP